MNQLFRFLATLPSKHRDIFVMILAYAIFAIGGSVYWAAIPILAQQVFGLTAVSIGFVMALIGVVYIVTDAPTGALLDYVGYRTGAIVALLFAGLTALIAMGEPNIWLFLVSVVTVALSWNIFTAAASAYILYSVPKNSEGKVFGAYGSIYKFGGFIATLFIGYIARWGFGLTGWFILLTVIVSLGLVVFVLKPEKRSYDKNVLRAVKSYIHGSSDWKRGFQAMKEFSPVSWVMAVDGFVGYMFSATLWLVIPLSLAAFSNPFLPEGIALGAFDFAGAIFGIVGGYLADAYSRKRIFLSLLATVAVGTFFLGYAPSVYAFFVIAFLVSAASDASAGPLNAMLASVDKKHDKDGTIYAFGGVFTDLGFIFGPLIGGFALSGFGLKGVFVFLGFLALADFVVATILLRKHR